MRAAELLGIADISFMEPNYESLIDPSLDDQLFKMEGEESIILVDEEEYPMAFGISDGHRWMFTNYLLRHPPSTVFDHFERLGGRVFQEEWDTWMMAVREYFSMMLVRDAQPALDEYSMERMRMVMSLVESTWGEREGVRCLDVGCGSGIGSVALRRLGYLPLAYDNDPSLLSLGITTGRLEPSRSICIDGTMASRYVSPTPMALCLMAGTIETTNAWIWQRIMEQVMVISETIMVTVGMEKESEYLVNWASERGRKVEVFENERDPFYDRWVCLIDPPESP
jgi:hypothetical protein